MAKFFAEKFPPGFFDVTQDVSRTLPVDIIDRWTKNPQSLDAARQLLDPNRLEGIVVCSDSAGLTRMTANRGLLEILALIDRPKQLIQAYGSAIGGQAVGIWAADNTEMFYPHGIRAGDVVSMLLAVRDRIGKECEVHVGFGAHYGHFYRLGDGLYGASADRVERIAEEFTEGGEIVITSDLAAHLDPRSGYAFAPRPDIPAAYGSNLRVVDGPRCQQSDPPIARYPIPYSDKFYADLLRFANQPDDAQLLEEVTANYSRLRAVVLLERESDDSDSPEIAVLNELALSLAMRKIGGALIAKFDGLESKTSGVIGIYTFAECASALAFARRFREALAEQQIACRAAIDYGDVLIFQLSGGLEDVAGLPVNIASKLAQDKGVFGKIYVSDRAARNLHEYSGFHRTTFNLAGVIIEAMMD
ncbi:MAG: family 3 adenylate cyclase [Bryobacteraceae bacterium]